MTQGDKLNVGLDISGLEYAHTAYDTGDMYSPTLTINAVPSTTGTLNINTSGTQTWKSSDSIYVSNEQMQINSLQKEVEDLKLQLESFAEMIKPLIERHDDLVKVREFINT